nr:MAG TPA: hypothetical protein [Caudoviricetes sp.]
MPHDFAPFFRLIYNSIRPRHPRVAPVGQLHVRGASVLCTPALSRRFERARGYARHFRGARGGGKP